MRSLILLLLALIVAMTFGCASLGGAGGPGSVSGTWKTEVPASYVIERSARKPQGKAVPHDHVELVERRASVEWQLVERPDGLITGTTHWISYGQDGEEFFRGTEPLLGARDRGRLVIEESFDEEAPSPQMVFHCAFDGPGRIRVIGYNGSTKDMMVMRFVLVRE